MSTIHAARALSIGAFACCCALLVASCIRLAPTDEFACESDDDCEGGDFCHTALDGARQCKPRCFSNLDCAFPSGCSSGTCTAPSYRCNVSASCAGYLCNRDGLCNRSCNTQSDCNADYTCRDRTCFYDPQYNFTGAGGFSGFSGIPGVAGFGGSGG